MKYPSMLPTRRFGSSGESLVTNGSVTVEPWAPSTADSSAHAFGGSMPPMRSFVYEPVAAQSRYRILCTNTTSGICQRASRREGHLPDTILILPVVHDQSEKKHGERIGGTKRGEGEWGPGLEEVMCPPGHAAALKELQVLQALRLCE